jgi:hypothetical protein
MISHEKNLDNTPRETAEKQGRTMNAAAEFGKPLSATNDGP